jgi:hypothetical protein
MDGFFIGGWSILFHSWNNGTQGRYLHHNATQNQLNGTPCLYLSHHHTKSGLNRRIAARRVVKREGKVGFNKITACNAAVNGREHWPTARKDTGDEAVVGKMARGVSELRSKAVGHP